MKILFFIYTLFLSVSVYAQEIEDYIQYDITSNGFNVYYKSTFFGNSFAFYGSSEDNLNQSILIQEESIHHNIGFSNLTPSELIYVKLGSVNSLDDSDTAFSDIIPLMSASLSSGDIKVYFNNPVDNSVSTGKNAIYLNNTFPDTIVAYLDRANESIDITAYNINDNYGIITALNDAYSRGVTVRFVGDKDIDTDVMNSINIGSSSNKIQSPDGFAPSGGFYGLMHNKFIVIDAHSSNPNDAIVITGSTNFTNNQLVSDPNNLIIFQDQSIAKAFTIEFEEMFGGTFGPEKIKRGPRDFNLNGTHVETYFSPKSGYDNVLREHINFTAFDLHFAVFSYTRSDVSEAIERAINDRGVFAAGILEQVNTSNMEYTILENAMPNSLFISNQPYLFHHKYIILDANCPHADARIATGSANWSNNGFNRNDENVVIVHNHEVANLYYQEFIQRYKDNGGNTFVTSDCDPDILKILSEEPVEKQVVIYPNPSSRDFYIASKENKSLIGTLFDLSGRIISERITIDPFSEYKFQRNELKKGNYILILEDENGIYHSSHKIIIL